MPGQNIPLINWERLCEHEQKLNGHLRQDHRQPCPVRDILRKHSQVPDNEQIPLHESPQGLPRFAAGCQGDLSEVNSVQSPWRAATGTASAPRAELPFTPLAIRHTAVYPNPLFMVPPTQFSAHVMLSCPHQLELIWGARALSRHFTEF